MTDNPNEGQEAMTGILDDILSSSSDDDELLPDIVGGIASAFTKHMLKQRRKPRPRGPQPVVVDEEVGDQLEHDADHPKDSLAAAVARVYELIAGGHVKAAPVPQMRDSQGQTLVSWEQSRAQLASEADFVWPMLVALYDLPDDVAVQVARVLVMARHNLGPEHHGACFGEAARVDDGWWSRASELMFPHQAREGGPS